MAKSRRTCYYSRGKDLWDRDRPYSAYLSSNKRNKVLAHQVERAWVAKRLHRELVQLGYK